MDPLGVAPLHSATVFGGFQRN